MIVNAEPLERELTTNSVEILDLWEGAGRGIGLGFFFTDDGLIACARRIRSSNAHRVAVFGYWHQPLCHSP